MKFLLAGLLVLSPGIALLVASFGLRFGLLAEATSHRVELYALLVLVGGCVLGVLTVRSAIRSVRQLIEQTTVVADGKREDLAFPNQLSTNAWLLIGIDELDSRKGT